MAIERVFGILKGRWRILLKRIDMPLWNIPDIVTAYLCLHNLCIIYGKEFDFDWARMAEEGMKKTQAESFGDLKNTDRFYALEASILEMRNIQKQVVQVEFNDPMENDTTTFEDIDIGGERRVDCEKRMKSKLQEAV